MLIVLFVFEIVIVILTIFTTEMVEHKYKAIQDSLGMYCNKRTYKTKADIDFIESIVKSYSKLVEETGQEPDLESAIRRKLQHESIGKFSYISVRNLAMKARGLMWGVLILEILVAWVNHVASNVDSVIIITTSLLLTVMMALYGIIKGVDEKGEALIDEVMHYIRNIYPLEHKKDDKILKTENSAIRESNQQDDDNQNKKIKAIPEEEDSKELSAKDIEKFLGQL